ncbi:MAG: radical SAM protein [Thermoplasmata archaeon]
MSEDPLTRYWSILDSTSEPRYLESKRKTVDVDLDADTATLWEAHGRALRHSKCHGGPSLLDLKIELANRMLRRCSLCERACGVDRTEGEVGHCGVSETRISSEFLHRGEEPDLVPSHTIFFSGCTFDCVFCQNWDISTRPDSGEWIEPVTLAEVIARKAAQAGTQDNERWRGSARNVNWVGGDPTSHIGFILETLGECSARTPQIWNSNMYLTAPTLRLLEGVIDVYLTDFKYGNDDCARRLSNVENYTEIIRRNHKVARSNAEMIIRHLVLPTHIDCCTKPILSWISDNLSGVRVNVMAQYRPAHRAREHQEISRPLKPSEYREAVVFAEDLGLDLCD